MQLVTLQGGHRQAGVGAVQGQDDGGEARGFRGQASPNLTRRINGGVSCKTPVKRMCSNRTREYSVRVEHVKHNFRCYIYFKYRKRKKYLYCCWLLHLLAYCYDATYSSEGKTTQRRVRACRRKRGKRGSRVARVERPLPAPLRLRHSGERVALRRALVIHSVVVRAEFESKF
jgi:hypothetical protein